MAVPPREAAPEAAERQALGEFLDRIRGLPRAKAEAVLRELDPKFCDELFRELARRSGDPGRVAKIAEARERDYAPRTDEELWEFIRDTQGLRIPRTAVCEGHRAPFELAADVYFERGIPDKAAVGNRGSGKSQIMGSVHAANVRTKRGHEGLTVGAIENQAKRVYSFFRSIVSQESWKPWIGRTKIGATESPITKSSVSIATGTISGVNSPHPNLAHLDELELFRPGVYDEAMNMAQTKEFTLEDGTVVVHRGMNVLTSSWKKPVGPVSALMKDAEDSLRDGVAPEYEIYRWCVWETTKKCEDDCSACPFANVVKGTRKVWDEETGREVEVPRTFEWACKRGSPVEGIGKLKLSDGFIAVEDTVRRFRRLPRRVWESQQESRKPTMEGLIYGEWDEDLYAVDWWVPDPAYGPITGGIDFGGTVPHHAGFWQHMKVDVVHERSDGDPSRGVPGTRVHVPAGADVKFDEVHVEGVAVSTFGRLINERLAFWDSAFPGFEVEEWYADTAAAAARMELRNLPQLPVAQGDPLFKPIVTVGRKYDVGPGIALIGERQDSGLVFIDRLRCEDTMNEMGSYEWKRPGVPTKEDDHAMDADRYRFTNVYRPDMASKETEAPKTHRRLRAIDGGHERKHRWDPSKLGVAQEQQDRRLEEVVAPAVGMSQSRRRRRPGTDPF